jgi:hypothetical protein
MQIRGRGIKNDLLPKEKVTWKFSPTENRFGFSKKHYTVLEQKLLEIYTGISFVCPSH